jgi:TonB family protein
MRTNKFIPFILALIIHLIPLLIFLKKNHNHSQLSEKSSSLKTIDLIGFSSSGNGANKKNEPRSKPSETVGLQKGGMLDTQENSNNLKAEPLFQKFTEPTYPILARKQGYEGKVKIKITFNENGIITKTDIIESSGINMLDEAVLKVAKDWRINSKINGTFEKVFEFKLNN